MYDPVAIVEAAAAALGQCQQRGLDEQAVYGLDALAETEFHPIIAAGLAGAGFGVLRERPYPAEWRARRGEDSKPRDRLRCDLVLTPAQPAALEDPLVSLSRLKRRRKQAAGTLYQHLLSPEVPEPGPACTRPEEAFWLEIKLVAQFCYTAGVPGPNRSYASELLRGVPADLRKLDADPLIRAGGVLLVLLTDDPGTAAHDLVQLVHRILDRGLSVASPVTTGLALSDRIGNRHATLSLVGLSPTGSAAWSEPA
ncbi:MAG TPA: hypothetical protein VD963_08670 [Phycisphaerales bacterium]|nr:hypothetical protein [Phycisphaerales bacterium]